MRGGAATSRTGRRTSGVRHPSGAWESESREATAQSGCSLAQVAAARRRRIQEIRRGFAGGSWGKGRPPWAVGSRDSDSWESESREATVQSGCSLAQVAAARRRRIQEIRRGFAGASWGKGRPPWAVGSRDSDSWESESREATAQSGCSLAQVAAARRRRIQEIRRGFAGASWGKGRPPWAVGSRDSDSYGSSPPVALLCAGRAAGSGLCLDRKSTRL